MSIPKLFINDTIVVNEKPEYFKFENAYQLLDKNENEIGYVQEIVPGWAKFLRLLLNKAMLPFELDITDENNRLLAKIKRDFTFFLSNIKVFDANEKLIGTFKGKFKLMGSKFEIQNEDGEMVGNIEGDWKGWDFAITNAAGKQIGSVNKKWAGALKEAFTTADKYKVEIDPSVAEDEDKVLMVSVAIGVDMVMKNN